MAYPTEHGYCSKLVLRVLLVIMAGVSLLGYTVGPPSHWRFKKKSSAKAFCPCSCDCPSGIDLSLPLGKSQSSNLPLTICIYICIYSVCLVMGIKFVLFALFSGTAFSNFSIFRYHEPKKIFLEMFHLLVCMSVCVLYLKEGLCFFFWFEKFIVWFTISQF